MDIRTKLSAKALAKRLVDLRGPLGSNPKLEAASNGVLQVITRSHCFVSNDSPAIVGFLADMLRVDLGSVAWLDAKALGNVLE